MQSRKFIFTLFPVITYFKKLIFMNRGNKREKDIFVKAVKAKAFLRIHGFLADSETVKINARLEKYQDKHKIEVSQKDFDKL